MWGWETGRGRIGLGCGLESGTSSERPHFPDAGFMTLDPLTQLVVILGVSVLVMVVLWFVQRAIGDAGVVDVGWSYLLGFSGVFAAVTGEGEVWPRVAIGAMAGLWGIRLGTHLLVDRVLPGKEDGRYQMFREKAGAKFQRVLFWFYVAQGVSVAVLAGAFVLAASNPRDSLGVFAVAGIVLWVVALVGESVADRQLARFKRRGDTGGRTCREGLWRYSRHPNYFFEWVMWVGYATIALGAPHGWLAFAAPVLILVLVLKVTGIPPTEARSVRSRSDYRAYQKTTSAFVPWPVGMAPFAGKGAPLTRPDEAFGEGR